LVSLHPNLKKLTNLCPKGGDLMKGKLNALKKAYVYDSNQNKNSDRKQMYLIARIA
jgi:hypothetical protein